MKTDLLSSTLKFNSEDFIQIIDNNISLLQKERRIKKITDGKINQGLIELENPDKLVVIGDIHGDLKSLQRILKEIDFENFLKSNKNKIIFLGDYIDRGSNSIQVLYVVCYLKQKYPDSIILMRGNHEAPTEFPFSSHTLPLEITQFFGDKYAEKIYQKLLILFRLLTLVTVIKNQLILVHGGVPTEIKTENYRKLIALAQDNMEDDIILEELLWNDPRSKIQNRQNWEKSRRGTGRHFGSNISKKWLEITNTKVIVRGHEPCKGFRIDHNNRIMTLFSCKAPYPAFEVGYIDISGEKLISINDASDLSKYVKKLD